MTEDKRVFQSGQDKQIDREDNIDHKDHLLDERDVRESHYSQEEGQFNQIADEEIHRDLDNTDSHYNQILDSRDDAEVHVNNSHYNQILDDDSDVDRVAVPTGQDLDSTVRDEGVLGHTEAEILELKTHHMDNDGKLHEVADTNHHHDSDFPNSYDYDTEDPEANVIDAPTTEHEAYGNFAPNDFEPRRDEVVLDENAMRRENLEEIDRTVE